METRDMTEFQAEGGGGQLSDNNSFSPAAKERFLNVDFLRFVFAVCIFVFHYYRPYRLAGLGGEFKALINITSSGYVAVQYFFIIAGFFLVYTLNKNLSVIDFIKKKIIRLWPLIAFLFVFFIFADLVGYVKHFDLYNNILSLLFLGNSGVTLKMVDFGWSWFVSVLFFVSIFYFYIFKYFKKTSYNFWISLLVLLGYTFIIHTSKGGVGLSVNFKDTINITNMGLVLGISGMGLGYLIHEFYQYLKSQPFVSSIKSVITYTIIEGYLLGFVIYETGFHRIKFNNKIILIVAFTGLFLTFLLKRGFISRILDNKFSAILGRYAFSLYMTHGALWIILYNIFVKHYKSICLAHPYLSGVICFIMCMIFAILTYHFVEVPAGKFLKKKFFPQKA